MPSSPGLVCRLLILVPSLTACVQVGAAAEILQLSLREAIRLALDPAGQARLQLAAEAEKIAQIHVKQARSATALQVDAGISDRVLRFDLRDIGVDIPQVSPFVSNVEFPTVVGPFSVLDSRVRANKSIWNKAAARDVAAARESLELAKTQTRAAANQIAAEAARAYLGALEARSEAELAAENVKWAQDRLNLARERRANGLITGMEVRRADLDVAEAQAALLAAQSTYRSALIQLAGVIGIPLDTRVELTEAPEFHNDNPGLEKALQTAFQSRPELEVAAQEAESLRLHERSIAAEALPTLAVFGDAGAVTVAPMPTGETAIISTPVYTAGFDFRVPILDGHRRAGQREEVESQIREANVRQMAARRQIEVEVRVALESLESAARQVELAEERMELAQADSEETRSRYEAREASGVELAEAQARVYRSRHDYIAAVSQHEAARIALAEATGSVADLTW
jgi:outer membrane protein TolC